MTAPITDSVLERYLAGDLSAEQRAGIEQAAASDAGVKARLDRLRQERDAFYAADSPAAFAHRLKVRLDVATAEREPIRRPWWRSALVPVLGTAMVVLFGVTALVTISGDKLSPQSVNQIALEDRGEEKIGTLAATPPAAEPPPPAGIVATKPEAVEKQAQEDPGYARGADRAEREEKRGKKGKAKRDALDLDESKVTDALKDVRKNKSVEEENAGGIGIRDGSIGGGKGEGSTGRRYAEPPPPTSPPPPQATQPPEPKKEAAKDAKEEWRLAERPVEREKAEKKPQTEAKTNAQTRTYAPPPTPTRPADRADTADDAAAESYAVPDTAPARAKSSGDAAGPAPTAVEASVAVAKEAPRDADKKADKVPRKEKAAAAPEPGGERDPPAAMMITTTGPQRVAFLGQTVRMKRGSPVRLMGSVSDGPTRNIVIAAVRADGTWQTLYSGNGAAITAPILRPEQNTTLVFLSSADALRLDELRAQSAKAGVNAAALKFVPGGVEKRVIRIVVE